MRKVRMFYKPLFIPEDSYSRNPSFDLGEVFLFQYESEVLIDSQDLNKRIPINNKENK